MAGETPRVPVRAPLGAHDSDTDDDDEQAGEMMDLLDIPSSQKARPRAVLSPTEGLW